MERVVYILSRLEYGGAEKRSLSLLSEIKKHYDVEIDVFLTSGTVGSLDNQFLDCGVNLIYSKGKRSSLVDFYRYLKTYKPKVVHSNLNFASGLYVTIAKLLKVKIRISHIRTAGDYGYGLPYKLKKFFFLLLLNKNSTKVIGVCNVAKVITKAKDIKWETVYNSFDEVTIKDKVQDKYPLIKNKEINIICIGRMHEAKHQEFCVEVLSSLKCNGHNAYLHFYGKEDPEIKSTITKTAIAHDVLDCVHFNGITESPVKVINKFDILLLPSKREGLPGVILEAIQAQTISFVSSIPGNIELACNFPELVFVVNEKEPDCWAVKIEQFISNNEKVYFPSLNDTPFSFDENINKIARLWGLDDT